MLASEFSLKTDKSRREVRKTPLSVARAHGVLGVCQINTGGDELR